MIPAFRPCHRLLLSALLAAANSLSAADSLEQFGLRHSTLGQATFENGVLTLTLPKSEVVKPKQIKIAPKQG